MTKLSFSGRTLFLSADPAKVQAQLDGHRLTLAAALPLRDDISTDEITPIPSLVYYDDRLGAHPYKGFKAGDVRPIGENAIRTGGFGITVAGRRYGKGSSREHSPAAERSAGIRLVIAESFERIYRQNADNLGLFTSTDFGLLDRIARGEEIDIEELLVGRDALAATILRSGGLLRYGQQRLLTSSETSTESEQTTEAPGSQTLFEKIIARHAVKTADTGTLSPGAGGFVSAPIPGLATARLELTALIFTAGISVIAACAFGLLPAVHFSGSRLGSLQQVGRGIVGRRSFTRDALVVVQTASALVLLVGSALLMRSFWQLSRVNAGYDTKNIFTFQIAPSRPELNDRMSMSRFQYAFMDRLKAIPGVESVGFITTLPLDEGAGAQNITTPAIQASGAEAPLIRFAGAGGAYFQTMGIELLRGRYFERVEEERGITNVIISQAAANLLFPGEDPLGRQVRPVTGPAA